MIKRAVGLMVLGFLGSCAACGCYDSQQVRAFLQKPRSPVSGAEYLVYPPDVIAIVSVHVPEIDGVTQQVRPDGKINLPLLGEVLVAGKTPRQIEQTLQLAARDYYEQVDATVQVVGYNSQRFYVFGQVGRPGPMAWTGRDTLLDVLAQVQPNDYAWWRRIVVIRGDQPQVGGYATPTTAPAAATQPFYSRLKYRLTGVREATKDRPRKKMTINLLAMVESGDMSNNVLLMPNDVVYVQPHPFAKVGLAIQAISFPLRALSGGTSDYRALVNDLRWIKAGMPGEADTRATIISR